MSFAEHRADSITKVITTAIASLRNLYQTEPDIAERVRRALVDELMALHRPSLTERIETED